MNDEFLKKLNDTKYVQKIREEFNDKIIIFYHVQINGDSYGF